MANVEVFARTEVGCARERNEDAFLVFSAAAGVEGQRPDQRVAELSPPGLLLAVCDGMGGAAAGDVASKLAVWALAEAVRSARGFSDVAGAEAVLLEGIGRANEAIRAHVAAHPQARGMGTTVVVAALFGATAVIANVGDSRAYLLRGRRFVQLTTDQSVVGQMVARGEISKAQARSFEQRNVLLQAVGVASALRPEILEVDLAAGDTLLLCTDGLTGVLDDDRIADIALRKRDPVRVCRALTEAACAEGAPDNVTVGVARFVGPGLFVPRGPAPPAIRRREATVGATS